MSYNQRNYYRLPTFGGFRLFPPVVKSLLISNVAVYILILFFSAFRIGDIIIGRWLTELFGLMPLGYGFYPWQLITYQFVHLDFWHLFFNMLFGLWMFGKEIEYIWGSKKFLFYYLFCGVMAGLAQLFLSPIFEPVLGPTIGASGAIYGILIAFAVLFPNQYIFLYFLIPVKVKYFVAFLILLGVISVGGESNIAHLAHLGGALAGYLYILYERKFSLKIRNAKTYYSRMSSSSWSHPTSSAGDIIDAKVYDIHESESYKQKQEQEDLQKRIDEILDKISKYGYQSLSDEEKKVLFEASKKMN